MSLQAGAARANITPHVGIALDGNVRNDVSQGTHDELYARALVLENHGKKIALVSCDLCGVSFEVTDPVRQELARDGFMLEGVWIWGTHTHSGPSILGLHTPIDPAYNAHLVRKLVGLVREANRNLEPARFGVGKGFEDTVAFNRRLLVADGTTAMNWEDLSSREVQKPLGPIDPELIVLRFESLTGKPIATIVNYALHPAILAGDNLLFSGDWPGYMSRFIERNWGGEVLFANGATGNINHIDYKNPKQGRGFREAKRIGTILGATAIAALNRIFVLDEDPALRAQCAKVRLDFRNISQQELEWAQETSRGLERGRLNLVDGVPDEYYALEILSLWERKQKEGKVKAQVGSIRLGDFYLFSMGAELFVEFGLALKEKLPCIPIAYCNEYLGYIPTKSAFTEGGYEPRTASWSMLEKAAGDKLVEAALDIARSLK
jgi:neutral ceramidase